MFGGSALAEPSDITKFDGNKIIMNEIFSDNSCDWKICQRNSDNTADIRFSGYFPLDEDENYNTFYANLVYEDNGTPIADRFRNIKIVLDANGRWECVLKNVPAGGLYRFETRKYVEYGNQMEFPTIHNIGVGDIWIVAGQSNAGGFSGGYLEDSQQLGVHMYTWARKWQLASHPVGNGWGHSPFLNFGRVLKKSLNIPIGIVPLAVGGSPLKDWNPDEGEARLYKRMTETLSKLNDSVKGMIWYQGCSDTDLYKNTATYSERFCAFAERMRKDLGQKNLPIIIVQLNRNRADYMDESYDKRWSMIREQQRTIPMHLSYSTVVPTLDLSLSDSIHTSIEGNMMLGQRLAETALGMVYCFDRTWKAPEIKSAKLNCDLKSVIAEFSHIDHDVNVVAGDLGDFTAEDDEGFVPISGVEIIDSNWFKIIFSRKVVGNAVLHGAYGADPKCDIRRNHDKMPILGFNNYPISSV